MESIKEKITERLLRYSIHPVGKFWKLENIYTGITSLLRRRQTAVANLNSVLRTNEQNNHLIIVGERGSGKSMFVRHSTLNRSVNNFEFMPYIEVSNTPGNVNILDYIMQQYLQCEDFAHRSASCNCLKEFLSLQAHKVCYVIDGFSLVSDTAAPDRDTGETIDDVVFQKQYCNSALIVVTRPEELEKILKRCRNYTLLDVVGFSERQAKMYLTINLLSTIQDKNIGDYLFHQLSTNGMISMTRIPAVLMIVCIVWKLKYLSSFPTVFSETQIYKDFTELSFRKAEQTSDTAAFQHGLATLNKIAWQYMQQQKSTTGSDEIHSVDKNILRELEICGILHKEETNVKQELEFSDWHIQEFFAACHIANVLDETPETIGRYVTNHDTIKSLLGFGGVLTFTLGLMKSVGNTKSVAAELCYHMLELCKREVQKTTPDGKKYWEWLCSGRLAGVRQQIQPNSWDGYIQRTSFLQQACIRNMSSPSLSELAAMHMVHISTYVMQPDSGKEGVCIVSLSTLWCHESQTQDCAGLIYEAPEERRSTENIFKSPTSIDTCMLMDNISSWTRFSHAQLLCYFSHFKVIGDNYSSAKEVMAGLPKSVKYLEVQYCRFTSKEAECVADILPQILTEHDVSLVFVACLMCEGAFHKICTGISNISNLTELYIGYCDLLPEDLGELAKTLMQSDTKSTLKVLYIHRNNFADGQTLHQPFKQLCVALTTCKSLQNLGLHTCELKPWALPHLMLVASSCRLRKLRVHRYDLGDGILGLVRCMTQFCDVLQISDNNIGENTVKSIKQFCDKELPQTVLQV